MARVPIVTSNAQIRPGSTVPVVPTGFDETFRQLADFANDVADNARVEEAEDDARRDQFAAGTGEQVQAGDGLFGPTTYSAAYNRVAHDAFTALKKTELENGLADLQTKHSHDPDEFDEAVRIFKDDFLHGVRDDSLPTFNAYFDQEAKAGRSVVETNRARNEFDRNAATLTSRLTSLRDRIGRTTEQDPDSPELVDMMAEYQVLLESASETTEFGQVLTPVAVQLASDELYATGRRGEMINGFMRLNTSSERDAYIARIERREYEGGLISEADERAVVAELNRRQNLEQTLSATTMNRLYNDEVASIRATGKGAGKLTHDQIRAQFGSEAEHLIEELNNERRFYEVRQSVRTSTPEEDRELLAAHSPSGENAAAEADRYRVLTKALEAKTKALEGDPAGYVVTVHDELRQRVANATDQSEVRDAFEAIMKEQERLGVHPANVRPLTAQQATELISDFQARDPQGQGELAAQLMDRYGPGLWTKVHAQLIEDDLPVGAGILGGMDAPSQAVTRQRLAEAMGVGDAEYQSLLGSETWKDIGDEVVSASQAFAASFRKVPGGAEVINRYRDSMALLAGEYVRSDGMSTTTAARRAFEDIVGRYYSFRGTYRIPVRHDPELVSDGLDRYKRRDILRLVEEGVIDAPRSDTPGITDEARREAYASALRHYGHWVTNADETGVILFDGSGTPVTVGGVDGGGFVEVSFEVIEEIARRDRAEIERLNRESESGLPAGLSEELRELQERARGDRR